MRSLALVVGIDHYLQPEVPDLSYCVNDAEEMASLLSQAEFGFEVELLLNGEATQRDIRLRAHQLRSTSPDRFLFFFAGHGEIIGDRAYLVSHDGIEGDYGLAMASLSELIELLGEGQSLAILDCCHAGAAVPWRGRASRNNESLFRETRAARGQALLAACTDDQLATEADAYSHGKLTNYVLDALLGHATDERGEVTVLALYDYVARGFGNDSAQRPVFKAQLEDRFVLARGLKPGIRSQSIDADIQQVLTSLQARIESLHGLMGVDSRSWRDGGWLRASTALEDLLHWKTNKEKDFPELGRSTEFQDMLASIDGYLSRLAALQPGTRIRDGVSHEIIGSGAFGSVYRIEAAQKDLAYKIYNSSELSNRAKVDRFRRGFRAMDRLQHPNIVVVHGFSEAPLGFLMDYIAGPNLRQIGTELGEAVDRIRFFKTICQAVNFAHSSGVLHRDIKPENVIVAYDNGEISDVYLTDFDLAWFSTATTSVVAEGGFGTIWYAAPEQLSRPDAKKARLAAVDVYSLGQLLFFMLTGRDPASLSQEKNVSVFEGVLRAKLDSALASDALIRLYRSCTMDRQSDRLADTDVLLHQIDQILISHVDVGRADPMDSENFLQEIASRVCGRLGEILELSSSESRFMSPSRRVVVDLSIRSAGKRDLTLTARFAPSGKLLVEGAATFAEARVTVNKRIDRRLTGLTLPKGVRVTRRKGVSPNYETFVELSPVGQTAEGAQMCSEIVSSMAALLDQYCS